MSTNVSLGSDTHRLELYVRVSLYGLLLIEPLVLVGAVQPGHEIILVMLCLAHTLANLAVCRWSLTAMRHRPRLRSRRGRLGLAAWAALSVSLILATTTLSVWASVLPVPVIVLGTTMGSISAVLSHRTIVIALLGAAAGVSVLAGLATGLTPGPSVGVAVAAALALIGLVYSYWLSAWMLRVINELVDARRRAAQLAVAEERLRIARDLHDLFGRTLAAVALKSELAAELLRRGRPEQAAAEIAAVRVLAEQSGGEVRQAVRGYRRTDLGSELAGASALLDSAGIRCVVHEVGADRLHPEVAAALAWMLREAVTNVIRHSRARECFITLTAEEPVRLVVTNDGASREPGPDVADVSGHGSGLVGMAERLAAVDGRLTSSYADGRFTVGAQIPATRAFAPVVPA